MGRRTGWLVAAVCAASLATAGSASAAGIVTHAWMADDARAHLTSPDLRALLDQNRAQLRSGAVYPDSGYVMASVPGGNYGEEAHWQRFIDAYADRIKARPDCGDLRKATGPCAPEVAHLMGAAAHGMGDETWDWLLEPQAADHAESYLPPSLSAITGDGGGIEFQMDMVAIGRHHRPTDPVPALPSVPDLIAAYTAIGRADVQGPQNVSGNRVSTSQLGAEKILAAQHQAGVEAAMPFMAHHFATSPEGGVGFGSVAVAGYMEKLWARLLGQARPTTVSISAPYPGQLNVPPAGWDRASFSPGAKGGGADNRIVVALSDAVPFQALAGASGPNEPIASGAMTLAQVGPGDAETPVALRDGYPRSVPYGADAGEHLVDIQPAANLTPCTTYRVRTTAALVDADHQPVTPYSWTFKTAGANDTRCDGDPIVDWFGDPASIPYVPIPTTPVKPPPVTTTTTTTTVKTTPAPTCRRTTLSVRVTVPKGARKVVVTSRRPKAHVVTLKLRKGKVTVKLDRAGAQSTLTVTGRVHGHKVTVTKRLPSCRSHAAAPTVRLPSHR